MLALPSRRSKKGYFMPQERKCGVVESSGGCYGITAEAQAGMQFRRQLYASSTEPIRAASSSSPRLGGRRQSVGDLARNEEYKRDSSPGCDLSPKARIRRVKPEADAQQSEGNPICFALLVCQCMLA
ncbi:hypothetical protein E4U42_006306 [Claviceps africana]|uniref:Uncharacterized protein n=1 Tax=Claviceps africana TaxID=83212 RepID=A0A8K0J3G9_9HYPO|nr:hypothetical protein E4U42_006306 [Claviceps africana]